MRGHAARGGTHQPRALSLIRAGAGPLRAPPYSLCQQWRSCTGLCVGARLIKTRLFSRGRAPAAGPTSTATPARHRAIKWGWWGSLGWQEGAAIGPLECRCSDFHTLRSFGRAAHNPKMDHEFGAVRRSSSGKRSAGSTAGHSRRSCRITTRRGGNAAALHCVTANACSAMRQRMLATATANG